MSQAQGGMTAETVIQQIVDTCQKRGEDCTTPLAHFVAHIVLRGEGRILSLQREYSSDDATYLIHKTVSQIANCHPISIATIKMQLRYYESLTSVKWDERAKTDIVAHQREHVKRRIARVRMCDAAIHILHRDIVSYLFLSTVFEDPSTSNEIPEIEKEISYALESVLPLASLQSFLQLNSDDRLLQLEELSTIVLGIRLYNKAVGRGGSGIGTPEVFCRDSLLQIEKELITETEQSMRMCDCYRQVIIKACCEKTETAAVQDINMLVFWNQHYNFINALKSVALKTTRTLRALSKEKDTELDEIKKVIESGTKPIEKKFIYPKLQQTSHSWLNTLQICNDANIYFGHVRDVLNVCRATADIVTSVSKSVMLEYRNRTQSSSGSTPHSAMIKKGQGKIVTRAQRASISAKVVPPFRLCPGATSPDSERQISTHNYCYHSFVRRQGLILAADTTLDVVQYKTVTYGFATTQGIVDFMKDPEEFIKKVDSLACQYPGIVGLFELYKTSKLWSGLSTLFSPTGVTKPVSSDGNSHLLKCDTATQTPLHFVSKFIDPDYEWNEWCLRRQALSLAKKYSPCNKNNEVEQEQLTKI